jgi:23S rRNA (guanosine2251-2'-O)-methyltransferase
LSDLIGGRNPLLEALKAGRAMGKIWLAKNAARHGVVAEILHLARTRGIPVEFLERQALDRLAGGTWHQGILAQIAAREYSTLAEILEAARQKKEPALLVILDGVEDPHNLGAILRTADAAGAHGIIVRERRAVGLTAGVEKSSAGALEYVQVARVANISQSIQALKDAGLWIIGVDQRGSTSYAAIDFRPATAIVLGAEGSGLSELVKKKCDFLAEIPMKGKINSLNASVAAAVVLYEALMQRSGRPASP